MDMKFRAIPQGICKGRGGVVGESQEGISEKLSLGVMQKGRFVMDNN